MKFLVLISNVPDTTTKIRFVDDNKAFDTTGVQWIINPWDELALTRAVELKEAGGIESITVANVGENITESTLRKALAVGADDAVRIDAKPKDAFYVATQLAQIAKDYDVIMAGNEASDYNGSAVGGMLAEILGFNSVAAVSGMDIVDGKLTLTREIDGGQQKIEVDTPVVTIVQKGIAIDPRIPAMRGIMMARKKPLTVVPPVEVVEKTEYVGFELPPPKAACKLVEEDNVAELIRLLQEEAKVL
jgi:electron transfer flavoprotein beta subunit